METRKFTQTGTFSIVVLSIVAVVCLGILLTLKFDNPGAYILIPVVGIILFCILVFYKLTIEITETHLILSFGTGLIKKTYRLSDIKSCMVVKNSVWYGIGIKIIPNGMLYNVSGLEAIELHFRHKNSIVRIGTDQPTNICRYLESKIGGV